MDFQFKTLTFKVLRHGYENGQNQTFLHKKGLNLLGVFMTKTTSIYHEKVIFCCVYKVYVIKNLNFCVK